MEGAIKERMLASVGDDDFKIKVLSTKNKLFRSLFDII